MAILPFLMVSCGHCDTPLFVVPSADVIFFSISQVEQDRAIQAKVTNSLHREEAVMKNVEGWKVGESVYSTRWEAPRN